MMASYMNILPPGNTWRRVYERYKGSLVSGEPLFTIQAYAQETDVEISQFQFDIDFVKARIFEILEPNLLTEVERYVLQASAEASTDINGPVLHDKLNALCSQ